MLDYVHVTMMVDGFYFSIKFYLTITVSPDL